MDKGKANSQTGETDVAKLAAMAKEEIAGGNVKYISFQDGQDAETDKILRWIIDHSPKWRSDGSGAVREELRRLGL